MAIMSQIHDKFKEQEKEMTHEKQDTVSAASGEYLWFLNTLVCVRVFCANGEMESR